MKAIKGYARVIILAIVNLFHTPRHFFICAADFAFG